MTLSDVSGARKAICLRDPVEVHRGHLYVLYMIGLKTVFSEMWTKRFAPTLLNFNVHLCTRHTLRTFVKSFKRDCSHLSIMTLYGSTLHLKHYFLGPYLDMYKCFSTIQQHYGRFLHFSLPL